MRNYSILLVLCLAAISTTYGQGGSTFASTMEVYVFPKEAQQADQQSQDEVACYQWAANNTGSGPFELLVIK